tara:strand:- start:1146 stop:1382 length:237 start_codon:yes stop_codon:yes gene_type:complete
MTTIEFMLDKIAKKRYNEKYKYCTKKQQMQCLIYLDQDLKIIRQKEKLDTHVKKCLTIILAILFIGLIGNAFINFFSS